MGKTNEETHLYFKVKRNCSKQLGNYENQKTVLEFIQNAV
jgi:hypothetical protein